MRKYAGLFIACGVLVGAGVSPAEARDEPKKPSNQDAAYDQAAIAATLEQAPGTANKVERAGEALEVPPPPPHKKGLVLEGSFGALGFLGKLNTVSPTASLFHLQLGYEPFRWFMVFAQGEVGFTSTSYSTAPRGYAIYGFGGGGRFTLAFSDRVAAYGQVDFGAMEASSDVLVTYGFIDSDAFKLFFGGTAGIEWYQVDPHYALAVSGGARKLPGFQRVVPGDSALALLGTVAVRYTF